MFNFIDSKLPSKSKNLNLDIKISLKELKLISS
jgi:hypothetical protein